ncbi:phosphatidate cytidylyltransferase [Aureibacillus halotolerans]|uniref:Phosphatidate cytidylyltransferase n=1 Tax=Aureibacillus halotolerans TaxID=1508390 RepID=A0A4R6U526_9BACI|nr:phosphatidate cytidylyltransferase [Aureibacillus halotolerans]TDQ39679.1 phosphatidate cytidylyltransferase [Aureibacillus halotolerans]
MRIRILTAVFLLLLFVPLLFLGGIPFTLLVYCIATLCLYEFFEMKRLNFFSLHGLISTVLIWLVLIPSAYSAPFENSEFTKIEILTLSILLLLTLTVLSKNKVTIEDMSFVLFGALYVGMGLYYLIELRAVGLPYILYALLIVWATDTGAYFVGKSIGSHKLWPDISPNKTTEGFVGGILCALAVSFLLFLWHPIYDSIWVGLVITAVLSVAGQMGDLAESAFKRHFGVKDSGKLLPGHGGVLDRIDSLIFILPILYLLHML